MRTAGLAIAAVTVAATMWLGGASVAAAGVDTDVTQAFTAFVDGVDGGKPATDGLALFIEPEVSSSPVTSTHQTLQVMLDKPKPKVVKVMVAPSGTAAWIAAEIPSWIPDGDKRSKGVIRTSAFLAQSGGAWKVVATQWSVGKKTQADWGCGALDYEWEVEPDVPAAATAPVKALVDAFDSSAAAAVAIMSDDKNAVWFGAGPKDKRIGGKSIKGALKKSKNSLSYHDRDQPGLPARAGLGPDGDLMWVELSIQSPPQFCTTYRSFFVLAKEKAGWRIVHQHYADQFSAGLSIE